MERVDSCETLVIGAGLVGAVMVADLVAEGSDVAVLEARGVASGATRRAAGMVLTGLPVPYAHMVGTRGREAARTLWELTVENRERLTSAAERLGVALERPGSLVVATDADEAALLRASAQMLADDGFSVRFEGDDPLKRGFAAALRYPDDVVVDAATLTRRLLESLGVTVHTGAEVFRLEREGDQVLVLARGFTIKAHTVILAVNAYAPLLDGYFADKITPVRGHTLLTHPLREQLVSTPGKAGPFSFRQTHDERLLFTAWSAEYETPTAGPGDTNTEIDLIRFVGRHFPQAKHQLALRESSVMGFSRDGLPLIGALPHLPQVFFAVGFGGYGLSFIFAAAELLTGLIVRGAEPALLSARRLE